MREPIPPIRTDRREYPVRAAGRWLEVGIVAAFTNRTRDTLYVDAETAGTLQRWTGAAWVTVPGAPAAACLSRSPCRPGGPSSGR